jgi:2-deoxy-D-gluconate 3-dehydrogenase
VLNELFDLSGKVAVVTGGGGGLGSAISLGLAGAGADVVPVDLTDESTSALASKIESLGRRTMRAAMDAADPEEVDAFVEALLGRMGRVDILINCVGMTIKKPILELSVDQWNAVQDANLKAVYITSSAVARAMKDQDGGSIVNMASMGSFVGIRTSAPYCAAKGGVLQLTKVMAQEWAPYGIRVNAIAPGFFNTRLFDGIRSKPEQYKRVLDRIPLGRIGEPSELVGAVVFLTSQASAYITGVCLPVDGGYLASGV